jgi:hypothetical protein
VDIQTPRYAVQFRPPGAKKWVTVVTCGCARVAWQAATDLMTTRRGDFAVRQLPAGCMENGEPASLISGTEPRGARR